MKTNKTFAYGILTVINVLGILFQVACKEEPPTPEPLDVTVSFVSLGVPDDTINFSPDASLPDGVTYILTDSSTPQKSWNSANGFDGKITASEHYSVAGNVIFTQTFYYYGAEITGANSKRTVEVVVGTFPSTRFTAFVSNTGPVTLKWP